jgi:mannose-6-phosphate isomerase
LNIYPLKFKPIFKEKIWGGRKLETVFGKQLPPEKNFGESWELVDLSQNRSVVANGPLAGRTLASVLQQYSLQITGLEKYEPPFKLLIKILDANRDLSVQVHPDADTCRRMGKGDPKTESWYILGVEKGAVIYKDLKPGVTRAQFEKAVTAGTTAELLNRIEVQPGENYFLPAGTVHAIGAGVLLAEVQTPSDTTYRVFDWNRTDENGQSRELHIPEALGSIHFGPNESDFTVQTDGRLVDSPFFKIDKVCRIKDSRQIIRSEYMQVLMILQGFAQIISDTRQTVSAQKGETILLPAAYSGRIHFDVETQYLKITI